MDRPPSPLSFLTSFWPNWLGLMSGGLSVPFTIAALFFADSDSQKRLFVALAVVSLIVAAYSVWAKERGKVVALQEIVTPRLAISFEPQEPWIKKLPTSNIPDPATGQILNEPSWWIRVQLQNTSEAKIAHNCRVFLQNVEFSPNTQSQWQTTALGDSLQLRWAANSDKPFDPIHLSHGERRFIDVFSTDPVYKAILMKWSENLIANSKLFSDVGRYRLTIFAVSEDAGSATIRLVVDWNGQWDQVSVLTDTQ
jgi:hypothetical protein